MQPRQLHLAPLFAVRVLRQYFKLDHRRTIALLAEETELREVLDFHDKQPNFITPHKASKKLLADAYAIC